VLSAADAETGLTMARAKSPDLILMDLQLPGPDGLAMKGDEERLRAAGCDGDIAKPIGSQAFLATIAEQLALLDTPAGERSAGLI
jgi:two-component system cell cycle response regulator DivK